ncbi:tetratricopeptide repeat protein [Nonomuraea sp. PA05]|nr:tetratricopeptide repeat protein [Nonomuraea sp. PA05]
MKGTASGQASLFQAGGDQVISQTVLPAETLRPITEVAAPPATVCVPWHEQVFVGREQELAELDTALRVSGGVVVAAVHGLGGIGKSTLAARYARAQALSGTCNPVWWITADSSAAVRAGLATLAAGLQPELAATLPLEALAERASAWLAAHEGWLVVLDDVTDPADVEPLLRRTLRGRVLVTSRLGYGWHRLDAEVISLGVLSEEDAVDLLTRLAGPVEPDGALELARELGCLPLAVEQAGGYLHQTRLTPRAYLRQLREQPAVMYGRAARGSQAERTVARIWRLTLDRLADTPLAGHLLRVLAWYGTDPIPRNLFGRWGPDADHAMGELAAFNMIALDETSITVHRLVQAVARTADPEDPHRPAEDIDDARGWAAALLAAATPESAGDPAEWPQWRVLMPHITALFDWAPPETDTVITARLLNDAGLFLNGQGATGRALGYCERALLAYERLRGADHSATLIARNSLAAVHHATGDLSRSISLYEATLADRERVLGPEHPSTLNSRLNLSAAYDSVGDHRRSISLLEPTLAVCERVLGSDHPWTLYARNGLAGAYESAGNLSRAIPLYEATLADRVRVLGTDHPDTLQSRNNLAYAYNAMGAVDRAIAMYAETVRACDRVLGPHHPTTRLVRENLAFVMGEDGSEPESQQPS